jgi:hypothetical protein
VEGTYQGEPQWAFNSNSSNWFFNRYLIPSRYASGFLFLSARSSRSQLGSFALSPIPFEWS